MSSATVTPPPQAPIPPTPSAPARMTAEEFGLKHAGDRVEYIDGQVKEIPMAGSKHGEVCNLVAFFLTQHVRANNLGRVFSAATFVSVPTKLDPERVYGADVCFVPYAKLAKDAEVPAGVLPVTPELVFEVRSPSDRWTVAMAKVIDYLGAGVPVVVVLDPATRTAAVYRNDDANPQRIFSAADELTLPDVLPGFAVAVSTLFA
jgi:Uma2 family endonuclease